MIYYIIFAALYCFSFIELFCSISSRTKRIIVIICLLGFIVLSSIYAGPIGDYEVYKNYFELIANGSTHIRRFEIGYELLNYIISFFTNQYWVLRAVLATGIMFFWYKIFFSNTAADGKYAFTMMLISWSLTFCDIFFVRSTVAVLLCMFSVRYIESKQIKKFLLCWLFAVCFHTMAIVWIVSYFAYDKVNLRKAYYCILVVVIIFSSIISKIILWLSSYMGEYIHHRVSNYILNYGTKYTMTYYDYRTTLIKTLINIIFLLIVFELISYYKKKSTSKDNSNQLINLYIIGSILYVASLESAVALARVALLFNAAQYLLIPRIFDIPNLKRSIKLRYFVFFIMGIYLLLRLFVTVNSRAYIPLKTII